MHLDERAVAPWAQHVHAPRDDLFARAAFAAHEHRGHTLGCAPHGFEHFTHGRRDQRHLLAAAALDRRSLGDGLCGRDRLFDYEQHLRGIQRTRQAVRCAGAERGTCVFILTVAHERQYRDVGAAVQKLGQRIRLRGGFSEQNSVEGLRLEGRQAGRNVAHRMHEHVRGSQRLA